MKKLINDPSDFVDETLDGILVAHPDAPGLAAGDAPRHRPGRRARPGKVAIATGGGSGHLPVFLGYVGKGLLDGCSIGNVFSSPNGADARRHAPYPWRRACSTCTATTAATS